MYCYYHNKALAVSNCKLCNKELCKNCIDLLDSGLCKDCLKNNQHVNNNPQNELGNTESSKMIEYHPIINVLIVLILVTYGAIKGYMYNAPEDAFINLSSETYSILFAYSGLTIYYGFVLFLKVFNGRKPVSTIVKLIMLSPIWIIFTFFCILASIFASPLMFINDLLRAFKNVFKLLLVHRSN